MLESLAAQAHAGVRAWRLAASAPVCEARAHVAYACKCAGVGTNGRGGGGETNNYRTRRGGRTYKEQLEQLELAYWLARRARSFTETKHSAQTARAHTHMRHDGMQGLVASTHRAQRLAEVACCILHVACCHVVNMRLRMNISDMYKASMPRARATKLHHVIQTPPRDQASLHAYAAPRRLGAQQAQLELKWL